MNDMKCPFCQQKLVRHWGMEEPALYCCDNPKCSRGGVATESAWKELIRTRKALDVAKDRLDTVRQYHRRTAVIGPNDIAAYCDRAIEQITALTKGGDNE